MVAPDECSDGVSVHYLMNMFLDDVQEAGYSLDSTIYEIEDLSGPPGLIRQKGLHVRCPNDGELGAAYVHCLEQVPHNVGPATYTWGHTIGDIVGTLVDFCKKEMLNPESTYFWICCLCVNQHRVVTTASGVVPTTEFLETFGRRVSSTGRILCMMAPWEKPLFLTRIWCIYEMSQAFAMHNCKVAVAVPPKEKMRLVKNLLLEIDDTENSPVDILYEALNSIRVECAEASQDADRQLILGILVNQTDGYEGTNVLVKSHLKEHLLGILVAVGKQCKLFDVHAPDTEDNTATANIGRAGLSDENAIARRGLQGLPELIMQHRRLRGAFCCILLLPFVLAVAWLIYAIWIGTPK